ncbi:MAG: hypothetical protein U0Q18_02445 [Bryobacteraceae bacterium]
MQGRELPETSWIAALSSDMAREARAADRFVQLALQTGSRHCRPIRSQIALCAATALANATALAAEVNALGGIPNPITPGERPDEDLLAQARVEVNHYQRRWADASRHGLLRLQELFRAIVLTKRAHLAHTEWISAIASRSEYQKVRESIR